ncbi:MAG: ABC transporter ATP-binding protein [Desulfobacterales bacterium]|nr:ABC transporter ATP-binding protein [Desulfobacterales bacterium]
MSAPANETLLAVRDLKAWFDSSAGPIRAVDGISFDVRRGECFALLGESGCGKSMTALAIMQLLPPQARSNVAGQVLLGSQDLLDLPEVRMRDVRGGRIGMIFQEPMTSLNPVMSIGAQIGESMKKHKDSRGAKARSEILQLLNDVGISDPERRVNEYPHQLSGGMMQRVLIAMTLAGEPELLIADEPTTALDVTIQAQILDLLQRLQSDRQMALMLITHDLGVVAEMADHVAVMYAGHIVEQMPRAIFFEDPRHPYTRKLFASVPSQTKRRGRLAVIEGAVPSLAQVFTACRFTDRCDYAWQVCRETAPRWIEVAAGHGVRCHLQDPQVKRPAESPERVQRAEKFSEPLENDQVLVKVKDLKVYFPVRKGLFQRTVGYVHAVDGLSLELRRGRTLALVGESGCGKTTAGKAILQLLKPSGGSVRYREAELTRFGHRALRPYRRDLQFIFQDPYAAMNPRMLVRDIIEEGMAAQAVGGDRQARGMRIEELLMQVGLAPGSQRRYPHEFSGGQRQRICIARALAVQPKVIVCDEPTSALDVSVQAQILNLLKGLQDELGLSYLFITHNISVVEYLAHAVAVMYLGRIVEQGTVDEVLGSPRHPYTQALLSAVPCLERDRRREIIRLRGDLPSPVNPPDGCYFHPRCPRVMPRCRTSYPGPTPLSKTARVHCHLYAPFPASG